MFATQANDKSKTPAQGLKSINATVGEKDAPARNCVWQSLALRPVAIQPKLAIGQPNDPYEREADQIADRVMRLPVPVVQRTCTTCSASGSPCPKCEAEQRFEVQRVSEKGRRPWDFPAGWRKPA